MRLPDLRCPRCGHTTSGADLQAHRGCAACARRDRAVAYECNFMPDRIEATAGPGIWRWRGALPVDSRHAVSLGEGNTPLLRLPRVASDVGIGALYVKNEAANPTGSHKDRLAAVAISAARQIGVEAVTGSSTGNHGAALAAYCAHAGLRCVIFATPRISDAMRAAIQVTGAELITAPDVGARYAHLVRAVQDGGWMVATNATTPPVGSSPIAVEGYKTIAYELCEQLDGDMPDWVVVPASYGDCLVGVQRGLAELAAAGLIPRAPRLAAVDRFGALEVAIASGGRVLGPVATRPTAAYSIGVAYTTDQAVRAVTSSDGVAITVSEDELLREQVRFGRLSGLYAEVSSSITIAAARRLVRAGTIAPEATVVCLLTATGLKDPATTLPSLPPVAEAPGAGPPIATQGLTLHAERQVPGTRPSPPVALMSGRERLAFWVYLAIGVGIVVFLCAVLVSAATATPVLLGRE